MNKRQRKKHLKKQPTLQEAWDVVADHWRRNSKTPYSGFVEQNFISSRSSSYTLSSTSGYELTSKPFNTEEEY